MKATYLTFVSSRESTGAGDSDYVEPIDHLNRWLEQNTVRDVVSVQEIETTYASGGYRTRFLVVYN